MASNNEANHEYVESKYKEKIDYYWKASQNNKRWYKITRILTIVLGAVVTLITSLSSADFIKASQWISVLFAFSAPLLAAILTIAGGLSQNFQFGATWHEMVVTAERLENERDRFLLTKPEEIDFANEAKILNDFVLKETEGFFKRILGSVKTEK